MGAYYRIDKDSISDMQAAIHEAGAIYVSANVHGGWFIEKTPQLSVITPVNKTNSGETGGHAFAIIGYTTQGFIVQNSWGPDWGYLGFAVMTYDDWVEHGTDAWVAVLGAPMDTGAVRTRSSYRLNDIASGKAEWYWRPDLAARQFPYRNKAVAPLSESKAYEHTVVFGNDGRPLNRFLDVENAEAAVQEAAFNLPFEWLRQQSNPKIAIYAHGGLNDEEASIKRIRIMAPYFTENGIYPVFITWRTGFRESLTSILQDAVNRFFRPSEAEPARGWATELKRHLAEVRDRSIEVACEQLLAKPIWVQMKQNASASIHEGAGLHLLSRRLLELKEHLPELEIHFIGHSAGSILLGHLLDRLRKRHLKIATCSLYAPACTVNFALEHYGPALDQGALQFDRFYFDILSDEREKADSVGPYGKSLLYLVSRALEQNHKTPVLGMEAVWSQSAQSEDMWHKPSHGEIKRWRDYAAEIKHVSVHTKERSRVWDGRETIPLAHGSFDNDVEVISATLRNVTGNKLRVKVENLHDF